MARGIPTQGQMRSQLVVLAGANFVATLRFSEAVLHKHFNNLEPASLQNYSCITHYCKTLMRVPDKQVPPGSIAELTLGLTPSTPHRTHARPDVEPHPRCFGAAINGAQQWPRRAFCSGGRRRRTGPAVHRPEWTPLQVVNETPMAISFSLCARQPRRQVPANDTPSIVTVPCPFGRSAS
jgi:hypothetical protein